ncbi:MAG: aspartate kinase [Oscillospiraceae bacterium]|nr:aspartate kinase [Oscillospiraceae bacterium]
MKVVKFGGSSLASAEQYRKVAAIVKADPERCYVVASAPGKRSADDIKITDMLYECYRLASKKLPFDELFTKIEQRYDEIIADLGLDMSLKEEYEEIRMALRTRAGEDYVASRGEYLGCLILAKFLGFTFIDAESGIFFRADGTFDDQRTYATIDAILANVDCAVIPGFYGSMPNGTIKTFTRGGGDITGAIVARAVHADIYENWTDVSGMLMADPRMVKNPRVIEEITYRELRELAYMGASVMHEETVFPVKEANIPINIRNTNAPADPGTMIVPNSDKIDVETVITGVAGRKGFSSVTVEKSRMNTEVGFGRKLLGCIEQMGISIEHVPSGIDMMSVVLGTNTIADCKDELTMRIFRETGADTVLIEDGIALICVVGRGMVRAKGTAARIFSAIAREDINIRMIDQFAGEKNIILGVDEDKLEKTLQTIYSEFVKD